MTVEERNKAGFRRAYEEGLNGGNLAVADELIDPEFLDRESHPACVLVGKRALSGHIGKKLRRRG